MMRGWFDAFRENGEFFCKKSITTIKQQNIKENVCKYKRQADHGNGYPGGPTLYSHSNRTAVTADAATLILYIVFITLFLAFVIIFPGVR